VTTIGLRPETTAAQLRAVLQGLRALLDEAPRVERGSASVRFVGIAATMLEVQMTAYILTRDWNEFLALREDVYLKTLDVLDAAGTALAGRPAVTAPT
jgi:MscS family membrane protein